LGLLAINGTLLAQILNFLILAAILAKFAYKPLMNMLEERRNKIAASIESAEKDKMEAQKLKQEYYDQLAQARTQAQAIVDKAEKLAEESKEEILTAAREESARLLKAVQDEIVREREKALAQIRNEVVAIAISAAAKIVEQNLDQEANAKLVDHFIDKLDQAPGGLPC
jgi:F-type H+-transporting ATPase subunit b